MSNIYKKTVFCCSFGAMIQACVVNLAPILFIVFCNIYDLTYEKIGRLVLFNFVTQLTVDFLAAKFIHLMKTRTAVVMAHGFIAVGFIFLAVLPQIIAPYFALCFSVVIYAIGGGLLEVLLSPITESIPNDHKSAAMSLMHGFYSWGQVFVVIFTTLALLVTGEAYWFYIPLGWTIFPVINGILFSTAPFPPSTDNAPITGISGLFKTKGFITAILIMLCAGASELIMSQWASLFAERGLGVSKVLGDLLGPCLFAVFMGAGRVLYGIFGYKINMNRMLTLSGICCVICYIVAVFAPYPFLSLMGCSLCGLTVSLMWPGTLSVTAERIPTGGVAMFALMAMFGDVGCSVGPWISGIVSDFTLTSQTLLDFGASMGLNPSQISLKLGILMGTIFPILLSIVTFVQYKREKK